MNMEEQLDGINRYFVGLVQKRASEFKLELPDDVPRITLDLLGKTERQWYPVPGMYGGFAYALEVADDQLCLHCESWCRVMGGSERTHLITATGVVQIPEPTDGSVQW